MIRFHIVLLSIILACLALSSLAASVKNVDIDDLPYEIKQRDVSVILFFDSSARTFFDTEFTKNLTALRRAAADFPEGNPSFLYVDLSGRSDLIRRYQIRANPEVFVAREGIFRRYMADRLHRGGAALYFRRVNETLTRPVEVFENSTVLAERLSTFHPIRAIGCFSSLESKQFKQFSKAARVLFAESEFFALQNDTRCSVQSSTHQDAESTFLNVNQIMVQPYLEDNVVFNANPLSAFDIVQQVDMRLNFTIRKIADPAEYPAYGLIDNDYKGRDGVVMLMFKDQEGIAAHYPSVLRRVAELELNRSKKYGKRGFLFYLNNVTESEEKMMEEYQANKITYQVVDEAMSRSEMMEPYPFFMIGTDKPKYRCNLLPMEEGGINVKVARKCIADFLAGNLPVMNVKPSVVPNEPPTAEDSEPLPNHDEL